MDGQWFRMIALDWYDRPYHPGAWSEYPFFPLFPAAAGALMKGGMPSTVALAGLAWLASLLAFAAIHRLAAVHAGPAAATWAVWFVALSPGALSLVLGYSDAFYLAALAWALVFAGQARWVAAGAAVAVATASRPNGWIAAVAVIIVIARTDRSWRAVALAVAPAAVFLLGWFWYLDHATGDPFVFWSAKSAWEETSIVEWAGRPWTDHLEMFHVAWFAVALVFYVRRVSHQPPEWLAITVLTVAPALLFGVVGLARYAVLAFPMQVAVADSLLAPSTQLGDLGRPRLLRDRPRILRPRRGRRLVVAMTRIIRCRLGATGAAVECAVVCSTSRHPYPRSPARAASSPADSASSGRTSCTSSSAVAPT